MKIKFLKTISLICSLTLIFSLLVGCSSDNGKNGVKDKVVDTDSTVTDKDNETNDDVKEFKNKELNIAVFEGGFGREFWDEVVAKFEAAYPGVKVNVEANPQIGELLRPRLLSGDIPDFIYLNQNEKSGVTMGLIKDHGILDITSVFNDMALDKDVALKEIINDGFLETKMCSPYEDGKIYLAPFNYTPCGLWYNKNLFKEKGWKVPETWDEFFAYGEKAKAEGRSLFTYQGIYPSYVESMLITSIASAGGLDTVNKVFNFEEGAWNSEAAKKALGLFQTIADNDYLLEGTIAMNHTQSQTEFMLGHALFVPNGSWFEGEMTEAPREDGFEFGFLGVPTFEESDQMYIQAGIEQMYIPKEAKNPELAKEFLKFLYTDASVKLNGEKTKGVMAVKGAADMCREYLSDATYNTYSIFDKGAKPLVFNWTPIPQGVNENPISQIYDPLSSIMNKTMTVEEWIDIIEKTNKLTRDAMGE